MSRFNFNYTFEGSGALYPLDPIKAVLTCERDFKNNKIAELHTQGYEKCIRWYLRVQLALNLILEVCAFVFSLFL